MKKYFSVIAFFLLLTIAGFGQEDATFTVRLSSDSILFGNYFELSFFLKNVRGEHFEPPPFHNFDIAGGPNMASSKSIINGELSQSLSYSYYLKPKDTGNFYILPASITVDGKILETEAVEVVVVPNPDGIVQEIPQGDRELRDFDSLLKPKDKPAKKKKKKRKIYKI